MAWLEPKTDWEDSDPVDFSETFQRIEEDIEYLKEWL